jgi:hypothetical protein
MDAGPTVASRRCDLRSSRFGLNIRNSPEPNRKNSLDEQIGMCGSRTEHAMRSKASGNSVFGQLTVQVSKNERLTKTK